MTLATEQTPGNRVPAGSAAGLADGISLPCGLAGWLPVAGFLKLLAGTARSGVAALHDGLVQQEFSRPSGDACAWAGELPGWSLLSPAGYVDGYWQWRGAVPGSAAGREAGWGYRAGFGGRGECGVLGARFEPHEYPYLRVSVAATLTADGGRGPGRFGQARTGLPLEYAGGVLTGALQEPGAIGPGTLTFDHAAVHEIDSSWEVFRLLAIGVVRLLALPPASPIPADLLPRFGASAPPSPGTS